MNYSFKGAVTFTGVKTRRQNITARIIKIKK